MSVGMMIIHLFIDIVLAPLISNISKWRMQRSRSGFFFQFLSTYLKFPDEFFITFKFKIIFKRHGMIISRNSIIIDHNARAKYKAFYINARQRKVLEIPEIQQLVSQSINEILWTMINNFLSCILRMNFEATPSNNECVFCTQMTKCALSMVWRCRKGRRCK